MGLKIYDCFSGVCITGLLSLLCDLIVARNVNNEVTFCMQFESSSVYIQRRAEHNCFLSLKNYLFVSMPCVKGAASLSV